MPQHRCTHTLAQSCGQVSSKARRRLLKPQPEIGKLFRSYLSVAGSGTRKLVPRGYFHFLTENYPAHTFYSPALSYISIKYGEDLGSYSPRTLFSPIGRRWSDRYFFSYSYTFEVETLRGIAAIFLLKNNHIYACR